MAATPTKNSTTDTMCPQPERCSMLGKGILLLLSLVLAAHVSLRGGNNEWEDELSTDGYKSLNMSDESSNATNNVFEPALSTDGYTGLNTSDTDDESYNSTNNVVEQDVTKMSRPKSNNTQGSEDMDTGMFSAHLSLDAVNTYAMQYSLSELVSRGNFITIKSVCKMARWLVGSYEEGKAYFGYGKCLRWLKEDEGRHLTDTRQLSDYDTIFVPDFARHVFIETILPTLDKDVVVIAGWPKVFDPRNLDFAFDPGPSDIILNHPKVLHMFAICPWRSHPKLSGFPLGIDAKHGALDHYAEEFLRKRKPRKHARIFVGYIDKEGFKADRNDIPSGKKLEYTDYIRKMHRHEYVLSPNGDHPDCFRHWEAIGLGTVPVTMLRPDQYDFMAPAPVVFSMPLPWNVTEMERTLPRNVTTNRRMVFEEYWYEYIDSTAGAQLNWAPNSSWDPAVEAIKKRLGSQR